jgi:hypothetical protein
MKEITLDSLTDEQLQTQAQLLINMIRSKYPRLDLRRGTALRDLLIDADAAIGALFNAQVDEQRNSSSLMMLVDRAENGEEIDIDDVNAILSNFNMKSVSGTKAKGYVRVFVSSANTHSIMTGVQFYTNDGVYFTVSSDTTASITPSAGEVKQYSSISGYWYLVPVEAVEVGANGNIEQGTALTSDTAISDFISASAYQTFSGGSDLEEIGKTLDRIKSSLSIRALTTSTAVESQLRDRFDNTDNPIVAISLCGYGNIAQHRDKHNLFGTAVGGRVDIYVRNFTNIPISNIQSKVGKIKELFDDGTATFTIDISHNEIPGIISVYSVSDSDTASLSSYIFKTEYSADTSNTWHDFDINNDVHEVANTVWRDLKITVDKVPVTADEIDAGEKEFKVGVVALPSANELQDYVDDGLVRNVGSDFVVRGPMIVNMSVNAVVRYNYATSFDTEKATTEICNYVNTSGFVGRITRSEISAILSNLGATSVDLYNENDMLYGYVYDGFGNKHELSGDALDLDVVNSPNALLTKDTTVFVLEPKNVQITTIPID